MDDEGGQGVWVEASVAEDAVEASQLALPLEALRYRIRSEVLRSRYVTSRARSAIVIRHPCDVPMLTSPGSPSYCPPFWM
ncbi:MAG: hypothetical protein ACT4OS_08280 [Acidimicrobiales bacterium]